MAESIRQEIGCSLAIRIVAKSIGIKEDDYIHGKSVKKDGTYSKEKNGQL
jgi:hypothetical protein